MAPNPKVLAAYEAMAVLGIDYLRVKPVLKRLLKLYGKNWEFIEEENYRALADAIFDEDENQGEEMEDEDAQMHVEAAPPLEGLHVRGQESQLLRHLTISAHNSAPSALKKPKLEDDTLPGSCSRQQFLKKAVSSDGNVRIEAAEICSSFPNSLGEEVEGEEAHLHVEAVQPLKRLRLRGQESQPLHPSTNITHNSAASALKKPKLEVDTLPESCSRQQPLKKAVSSDRNVRMEAAEVSSACPNSQGAEMESEEAHLLVEAARPLKRLLLRGQESQPMHSSTYSAHNSVASALKKPKLEYDTLPESCSSQQLQKKAVSSDRNVRIEARSASPGDGVVDKGKQPASPQVTQPSVEPRKIAVSSGRNVRIEARSVPPGDGVVDKENQPVSPQVTQPSVEPRKLLFPDHRMPRIHALIIPKDEPLDEPDYVVPIAMIPPEPASVKDSSMKNGATRKQDGHVTMASQRRDGVRDDDIPPSSNEKVTSAVEIASSALGEVKMSLSCSSAVQRPDFCMPSRDQLLKMVETKCLQSYKITDPDFSVMKLLTDMCDCLLEFRTDSNDESKMALLQD